MYCKVQFFCIVCSIAIFFLKNLEQIFYLLCFSAHQHNQGAGAPVEQIVHVTLPLSNERYVDIAA